VTIKCVSQKILLSGFGGRKARSSMGKISNAEVLRLRATSAVSRDQSVTRSAQDDDSVGEPEEKQQVPPIRLAPVGMTNSFKKSMTSREKSIKSQPLRMTILWEF
jgi:hypothetical protein